MPVTSTTIRHDIAEAAEILQENLDRKMNTRRQNHVLELAKLLNTKVVQLPRMAGMMFVEYEPPKIEGPVIYDQTDYAIMLHELGHVSYGHTQGRPPYSDKKFYFENGVLRSECQAWRWALTNSEEEFSTSTREFIWNRCLGTYYSGAMNSRGAPGQRLGNGNRHHVAFSFDKPDDFFWRTVQMILGTLPEIEEWVRWHDGSEVLRRSSRVTL